jgi:hypothetical protein
VELVAEAVVVETLQNLVLQERLVVCQTLVAVVEPLGVETLVHKLATVDLELCLLGI